MYSGAEARYGRDVASLPESARTHHRRPAPATFGTRNAVHATVTLEALTTDRLTAAVRFGRGAHDVVDLVHGGALASVFDEAFAHLAETMLGEPCRTSRLSYDLYTDVPTSAMYTLEARVLYVMRRRVSVEGCLRDQDGEKVAGGHGLFSRRRPTPVATENR